MKDYVSDRLRVVTLAFPTKIGVERLNGWLQVTLSKEDLGGMREVVLLVLTDERSRELRTVLAKEEEA